MICRTVFRLKNIANMNVSGIFLVKHCGVSGNLRHSLTTSVGLIQMMLWLSILEFNIKNIYARCKLLYNLFDTYNFDVPISNL